MPKTQHDQLCDGLIRLGAIKLPKKNKYTMFKLGSAYYFVGRAGALRVSNRPNAASSIPSADHFRNAVLNRVNMESLIND